MQHFNSALKVQDILRHSYWWDKSDENNISCKERALFCYRFSKSLIDSEITTLTILAELINSVVCVFVVNNNLMFRNLKKL